MDQPASFEWAPVDQSLAGSWKGSAEVHSPPSGARVKDERKYTILSIHFYDVHKEKRTLSLLQCKTTEKQPSNLEHLKNCFSVIYHEQN